MNNEPAKTPKFRRFVNLIFRTSGVASITSNQKKVEILQKNMQFNLRYLKIYILYITKEQTEMSFFEKDLQLKK